MRRISFFCELPPPYGGVTVKNQILFDEVFLSMGSVNVVDFGRIKRCYFSIVPVFAKMMIAFMRGDTIIYGFGSYKRLRIAMILQKLFGGKKSLRNTINIVMGGTFAAELGNDNAFLQLIKVIRVNLVETKDIKDCLKNLGVRNSVVFPNPKSSKGERRPVEHNGELRCVFFSKICKEKGCDYILNEFINCENNNITVDFYGHIDPTVKEEFLRRVNTSSNLRYRGVFDSAKNDVYAELNQYDVLLFPTTWVGEGVPGILIEAKMAGIVPVVSDWNYNKEIVKDGVEGVVLENLEPNMLLNKLIELYSNPDLLNSLKEGSFHSRQKYAIENYKKKLINLINR